MKNKFLSFIVAFCMIIPFAFMLSGCQHEHTFAETWTFDNTHHWHESTCEHSSEKADYAEHIDEDDDNVCDVCYYGAIAFVGEKAYTSLKDAVAEVGANETIVLSEDIDMVTALEITKPVTIDLNWKTLSISEDMAGNGVFWVTAGGDLTINGDGIVNGVGNNEWNMVIWAQGGNVTINGGTYTNVGAVDTGTENGGSTHFDVIYASAGGSVEINGGTFKGQTPAWLLNKKDADRDTTSIEVKGGTFVGFNPADNLAEGKRTNFVADNYTVDQNGNNYTVRAMGAQASINGVEYNTLQDAINAVQENEIIVLNENLAIKKEGFTINKQVTLSLNGKTISAWNSTSLAVFKVENPGSLTILGEGTIDAASQANDYSMAVWARNGGKVIIQGGTFTNVGAKDYEDNGTTPNNNELIYTSGTSSRITINGGKFIGNYENKKWGTRYTLNKKDNDGSAIIVKGGEFHRYNPAESLSEDPQANFVATGYVVEVNENVYSVRKLLPAAMVNGTTYNTLQEAYNAVQHGGEIVINENIDLTTALTIDKEVTINLNGKTLTVSEDTAGDGVFHVVVGGNLIINGDGIVNGVGNNDWNIVVFADGGNVTINGGTYTNVGALDRDHNDGDHFDVIYAKNGSHVVINGGTFKGETPKWILNSHDTSVGTFEVRGGTFEGYNPSVADTEPGDLKNWLVPGYTVQENNGVYTVVAE